MPWSAVDREGLDMVEEVVPERWVPGPPPGAAPGGEPAAGTAAEDLDVARARPLTVQGALAATATAYTAAYGHPLTHDDLDAGAVRHRRWSVTPRVALVASGSLALLLGAVLVVAWRSTPGAPTSLDLDVETVKGSASADRSAVPSPSASSTASPADPAAPSESDTVVVHVVGQVAAPGVVTVPAGARVADAIEAAGGATAEADLAAVNLARVAVDGEQIVVPRPGEQVAASGAGGSGAAGAGSPAGGLLDLNTATLADLDALPGIGPVLAQRILDWRAANGDFTNVDELGEVTGIGDALLERLRAEVQV